MEDLDELILTQLRSVGKDVGNLIVGILSNDISRDDQISFAHRLVDIAEAVRERALKTSGMVIEGGVLDDGASRALPCGADGRDCTSTAVEE